MVELENILSRIFHFLFPFSIIQWEFMERVDLNSTVWLFASFLQYFHDEHCQETRAHLEAFSMDYKAKIDEAKKKLKEVCHPCFEIACS